MYDLCVTSGRSAGERHRLVPLPPGLRLLAVRHRRLHADAEPELPGAVRGHRHRPGPHHLGRQGQPGRLQNVPQGGHYWGHSEHSVRWARQAVGQPSEYLWRMLGRKVILKISTLSLSVRLFFLSFSVSPPFLSVFFYLPYLSFYMPLKNNITKIIGKKYSSGGTYKMLCITHPPHFNYIVMSSLRDMSASTRHTGATSRYM